MNILLIDDDVNLLKLLRRPLARVGHSITEATDGKQGWDLFAEHPSKFDVLITDIKMPVLSGIELLRRLRDREYDVPVIIITGYEDIRSSIEILRFGAFDLLLKPFNAPELLEILGKLESLQDAQKKRLQELPFFKEQIQISIHSQPDIIPSVVAFLQDRLKLYCKLYKLNVRNIGLCLHEALVNAIVHGNLEIPSTLKNEASEQFEHLLAERAALPEYVSRQVSIRGEVTAEQLWIEIEDQGSGFNPAHLDLADPTKMIPSGRGLLIITAFMDHVSWNHSGNRITMIKYFSSEDTKLTTI
ncbi:response regulator receiver [Candidatus Moduliflexus flocculans]|uniref:Response regulator receiver n=1 Tax=Candidatus Moduliflexus flocculans TaxID=1499966 RepID=A0A081BPQ9_9BACT|nr:response regulator receiver [Candidatus Moduliflexus flocculans]